MKLKMKICCNVFTISINTVFSAVLPHWLIHKPSDWHNVTAALHCDENSEKFKKVAKDEIMRLDGGTDGEVVDAMEHYFWGMSNGVAMELGALDGSPSTKSMTHEFEKSFGWRRVLVEGNPKYRNDTIAMSPYAFAVNAAICEHSRSVHFVDKSLVGGIVEFMGLSFLKLFHPNIVQAGRPAGNLETVNWTMIPSVAEVSCIPLRNVLHVAGVHHINFFILDVEGGELMVLKSINWKKTRFDVLCVETDPLYRPPGYADQVTAFLAERGYKNDSGQVGRNIWYIHENFRPSERPGLSRDCFNGQRRTEWQREKKKRTFHKSPAVAYQPCPPNSSTTVTT